MYTNIDIALSDTKENLDKIDSYAEFEGVVQSDGVVGNDVLQTAFGTVFPEDTDVGGVYAGSHKRVQVAVFELYHLRKKILSISIRTKNL